MSTATGDLLPDKLPFSPLSHFRATFVTPDTQTHEKISSATVKHLVHRTPQAIAVCGELTRETGGELMNKVG